MQQESLGEMLFLAVIAIFTLPLILSIENGNDLDIADLKAKIAEKSKEIHNLQKKLRYREEKEECQSSRRQRSPKVA